MEPIAIAAQFAIEGSPVSCAPFGHGHINRTFRITTDASRDYVLQAINTYVFRRPLELMENAVRVTEHIRTKGYTAMRFVPTLTGEHCFFDPQDGCWRVSELVPGFSLDTPESGEDFYQSALAFGQFQDQLADFPAQTLHETIPNFHHTPDRYRQLKESIAANASGRLDTAAPEVAFYLAQEELGARLQQLREAGELPLRVTHNDTKLNNVLLDPATRKPLCVLDLDTVMPGLSAYDFGDAIRFGAVTAAEDEQDASRMKLDAQLFRLFTRGFLEACPALTEREIRVLPLGAFTMTLECGSRFLKDYLDGDVYYHIDYPTHNLVRSRTQMALCADMLRRWQEMEQILEEEVRRLRS